MMNSKQGYLLFTFIIMMSFTGMTQTTIDIQISGYANDDCYLAYYFGDKQYLKDTVQVDKKGKAKFHFKETLDPGIYMVVLSDHSQADFLYDGGDIGLKYDKEDPGETMVVTNSKINEIYYSRVRFLGEQRAEVEAIENRHEGDDEKKFSEKKKIDEKVKAYDEKIIRDHANTMVGQVVRATQSIDIPEDIPKEKKYLYFRDHIFDNFDFSEKWIVRSPMYDSKLSYYIDKLTVRHPDSIIVAIDNILAKQEMNDELFSYTVTHLLNKYVNSSIMGYDKIYVHFGDNYYLNGKAPWASEEFIAKMKKRVDNLRNCLIGGVAKDLNLHDLHENNVSLLRKNRSKDYDFTILFFWSHDCGTCEKSLEKLKIFNETNAEGVEIIDIQTNGTKPAYEDYLKSSGYNWVHTLPQDEEFRRLYDILSTPKLFVLDKDDKIIAKNIDVDQINSIIDFYRDKSNENK